MQVHRTDQVLPPTCIHSFVECGRVQVPHSPAVTKLKHDPLFPCAREVLTHTPHTYTHTHHPHTRTHTMQNCSLQRHQLLQTTSSSIRHPALQTVVSEILMEDVSALANRTPKLRATSAPGRLSGRHQAPRGRAQQAAQGPQLSGHLCGRIQNGGTPFCV